MKHLIVVLFTLFCFGKFASGQQQALEFSINDAIEYALENNKTLKNARDDIKLASEQVKEARAAGLPKVDGSVDYMTNFNYEFEFNFGGGSSEPPQIDYTKLDPGDYEVLSFLDQMFGSSESSAIVMSDQASANIQVTQLLFSGQYWVGLQMAKLGESIRKTSLENTELDVKGQVVSSYYLILSTQELLKVIENNASNLKEIHKHTNNLFMAGMAEQTDVDQLKINLSMLENSRNEMERNLQLNYNMFRFLLGIESNEEVKLTDDLSHLVNVVEVDAASPTTLDIQANPGFRLMQSQEQIGEKQVDLQKWSYGPTLAGFYSYKEKMLTSGFDISPKNAAGLTLSIPIFAGGTKKAQLSQKKIELDQIRRNKSLMEEQLALQNNQLSFELKSALDNYLTQKENVKVAERVFKSFQNKFKQGMVSSLELTQANSNYLQAESNYVSAVMKLLQSKLAVDKLNNKI